MQAEAAEAQSLQDADTIEQMQSAIGQLSNVKIEARPAQQSSTVGGAITPGTLDLASPQSSSAVARDKDSVPSRMHEVSHIPSRDAVHGKDPAGTITELQTQLSHISKEVASLKATSDSTSNKIMDIAMAHEAANQAALKCNLQVRACPAW